VRAFFCKPFNEVFIVCMATVIFIVEADSRNDRYPCLWPCKTKHEVKSIRKEVLSNYKDYWPSDPLPVNEGPEAVKHYSGIDLPPVPTIPVKD